MYAIVNIPAITMARTISGKNIASEAHEGYRRKLFGRMPQPLLLYPVIIALDMRQYPTQNCYVSESYPATSTSRIT